jgi:fumarate hydratase class I
MLRAAVAKCTYQPAGLVRAFASIPDFKYEPLIQTASPDVTPYRKLTSDHVSTIEVDGRQVLKVEPEGLQLLSKSAMVDIAHLLRPAHLQQLSNILSDPEASDNDRFVALELLKNANIASGMILPGCQDTGTAIVMGKRGQNVWTDGNDEEALSKGVFDAYTQSNLRYSQVAPLTFFDEKNTGCNLPAQIDLYATSGNEYTFQFMAKGGGSANKTYLYQETKALLNPKRLAEFVAEKVAIIGTAACPPYHLALAVGGLSAEMTLKAVKLASTKYYDRLPDSGSESGRAFRDHEMEEQIHKMTQDMGIGAQFGGKYFCHDVRVVRLPRHGASCPVGLGVSCSADRQALGKITPEGIFLEQLETDPSKYMPEVSAENLSVQEVKINTDDGMANMLEKLNTLEVSSRVSLSGTVIVARDIAHAKIQERLNKGEGMPQYLQDYPVYYAGPAKTPDGMASGSFGPTTAGRMDSYVDNFQAARGSMVMLAKGNRSKQVTNACKKHGGFYLGSPGGPAAVLASNCIKKVEVLEYPELGMEAVWKIQVENFPAFVIVDNKGNDFFKQWLG